MTELLTLTRHGRVGVITLDNPPVNALSHAVRQALVAALSELYGDAAVEAIVIRCAGRTFIAGADIGELGKPPLAPDVPEVVELLDGAPKLVLAAIHGAALGGGLELALACHGRLATETSRVGLPEVTLGILPGAGGTQRLPRLVGVRTALELIVGGEPISASTARRAGLLDEVVGDQELLPAALSFAERALVERRPLRRTSELSATLDEPNLFADYERAIAGTRRGVLAPSHCIQAVRASVELPFREGLERERALFRELVASPQAKAQRHVFLAAREVAKVPGLPSDTPTRPVKSVAVVGTGARAGEIVNRFVDAGLPVVVLASTPDDLERHLAAAREAGAAAAARGRSGRAESDRRADTVRTVVSYDDLRGADLLIEAVAEDPSSKREVFASLDRIGKAGAILATSTAFLDVDGIASMTARPEDVVGMHFVRAADGRTLLENVRTPRTAPEVFATVMKLGRTLGATSVPVRGLVAARLRAQGLREPLFLLEEGASPEQVDGAFYDFGFPSGPFAELDRAGVDGALAERRSRFERLGPRERTCTLLEELCEAGRVGRRSGAGFYRYDHRGAVPDPDLDARLTSHSKRRGIPRRTISEREILERCLYAIINDAAYALEEGLVARPADIDVIWTTGFGFPVHRGGPLFYADQVGLRTIREGVLKYRRPADGEQGAPAPLIERLAERGSGFYGRSR